MGRANSEHVKRMAASNLFTCSPTGAVMIATSSNRMPNSLAGPRRCRRSKRPIRDHVDRAVKHLRLKMIDT